MNVRTPSSSINYEEVVKMMETDPVNVYEELMRNEKKVLDAVNVLSENEKTKKNLILSEIPVKDIYFKFVASMKQIFLEDLLLVKSPLQIPPIFLDGSRKIYTGILIVSLSVFLFIVFLST